MSLLKRSLGAYLVLVAAAVAANFVLTPIYQGGGTEYPVWQFLNWFMAAAVLIAVVHSWTYKCQCCTDCGDDRCCHSGTSVLFYSSIVVGLLYFHNWFLELFNSMDITAEQLLLWNIIDASLPVILGACGVRLWKEGSVAS